MVLIQEPHLKNYRFSVTWCSNHHTRRGKLTGWPDSLVLSEDDLLNPQVDYAIQYGRHRGQEYPLVFWHLALLSKHNPGGDSSVYLAAEWPFVWRGHHQKSISNISLTFGLFSSLLWSSVWVEEVSGSRMADTFYKWERPLQRKWKALS